MKAVLAISMCHVAARNQSPAHTRSASDLSHATSSVLQDEYLNGVPDFCWWKQLKMCKKFNKVQNFHQDIIDSMFKNKSKSYWRNTIHQKPQRNVLFWRIYNLTSKFQNSVKRNDDVNDKFHFVNKQKSWKDVPAEDAGFEIGRTGLVSRTPFEQ